MPNQGGMLMIFKRTALALALMLALSLCLFSGCELQPEQPRPSETTGPVQGTIPGDDVAPEKAFTAIDPDYFELLAEDCDVTIHTQAGVRLITFMLVSAQPLGKYDVTIGSDQGTTARVRLTQANMQTQMPLNVYLCYQNFDWKDYWELEQLDHWAAEDLMSQYEQERNQHRYNRLFSYRVQVLTDNLFSSCKGDDNQWVLPQETVEVKELTITVKGQTRTYHPKCLRLTSAPLPEPVNDSLISYSDGLAKVNPTADGRLYSDGFLFKTELGAIFHNVSFPDRPDCTANPSRTYLLNRYGGFDPSLPWVPGDAKFGEGSIEPGKVLKLELGWTDSTKAGLAGGTGLLYATFDYEERNIWLFDAPEGAPGQITVPLVYNIFGNAYEYYAQAHDGVDIISYYRDYVAALRDLEIEEDL